MPWNVIWKGLRVNGPVTNSSTVGVIAIKVTRVSGVTEHSIAPSHPTSWQASFDALWDSLPPAPVNRDDVVWRGLTHVMALGDPIAIPNQYPTVHRFQLEGRTPWAAFYFRYHSESILRGLCTYQFHVGNGGVMTRLVTDDGGINLHQHEREKIDRLYQENARFVALYT